MRKHRLHVQKVHPLSDAPFHADQPEPELVLKQFPDRPDPTVPEVIDVVHITFARLEIDQVSHHLDDVLGGQGPLLERQIKAKLLIKLEATDRRQIVALRVEEQILKERLGRLNGRGLAWPQSLVDLDHGLFFGIGFLAFQRVLDNRRDGQIVPVHHFERVELALSHLCEDLFRQPLIFLEEGCFGARVHQINQDCSADDAFRLDLDLFVTRRFQSGDHGLGQLRTFPRNGFAGAFFAEVVGYP